MLAFVSLTTPLLLGGLALLALPLAAHLMHRHSQRTLVFPNIALLMAVIANQSRLSRLRRLILLFLRMLALACVVLAFTRPVWLDASADPDQPAGAVTGVVLLVDVSASMGQKVDGITLHERTRGAVDRALDSLRSGTDLANIVLADANPRALFPRLSANLPALRDELSMQSPTHQRADLPAALSLAGKLLADHDGPRRVIVFSDLQESNWSELLADSSLYNLLPEHTVVSVADIQSDSISQVALSRPRHFPVRPLAGQPCDVSVRVVNHGNQAQQVPLRAEIVGAGDVAQTLSQTITLAAREDQYVTFPIGAPLGGFLQVTFSIPQDALEIDDAAYLVVGSSPQLPVIVISDEDPDTAGTAAYYIIRTLTPLGSDLDQYTVRHVRSRDIESVSLSQAAAVFVGYIGELSEASATALVEYVNTGGGLVFFCGDGPIVRNLETLQSAAGERGILPWHPGTRRSAVNGEDPLRITAGRWQSRWFREFDEQSQLAVARILFHRIWSAGTIAPTTDVLLSYSDGTPALGSRLFGEGQFLLAGFSPDATASDLGKHGAFVAWMQILAKNLQTDSAQVHHQTPGAAADFPDRYLRDEVGPDVHVLGPDGSRVPFQMTEHGSESSVGLMNPETVGFYELRDRDQTLAAISVNVDPRESDLRTVAIDELQQVLTSQGIASDRPSVAGWKPFLELEGRPLWGNCFALAFCALGLELFLLGLWKK